MDRPEALSAASDKSGVCCRICHMGPAASPRSRRCGVCGADADTIVARNYLREVAGGTAAHSDHGRHLVLLLKKMAEGKGGGYTIKDETALRTRSPAATASTSRTSPSRSWHSSWPNLLLAEFTSQEEHLEDPRSWRP